MHLLDRYDYALPEMHIAKEPTSPRDAARLFVYDTKTDSISLDTFRHIGAYLPSPSLLIFNDTKVVPARLWLTKPTGGKIQVLLMLNEPATKSGLIKGIVDRKLAEGSVLTFPSGEKLTTVKQEGQFFYFLPSVPRTALIELIARFGKTPIPPYVKNGQLTESALRVKYQSMFATHPASVAAPTASLHFTPRVMRDLKKRGMAHELITLHVGMGTFGSISDENFQVKKLFPEYYEIGRGVADAIAKARKRGVPVIPVGTTTLRTLESALGGSKNKLGGSTELFIFPPYHFKVADALVTNFHVPRSSLMLLVDAFLEHKKARRRILDLYKIALSEQFRFYSFGDGMLIT